MKIRNSMVVLGVGALLNLSMAGATQALSVTYVFDYYTVPPHVSPHTPIPGGPFGTITISDSLVDPNRVDIKLIVTPPAVYVDQMPPEGLEQFYINFDSDPDNPPLPNDPDFLANHQFYLVKTDTPAKGASNTPFTAGELLGVVGYTSGAPNGQYNLANFVFDLRPNPTSTALIFEGSLALYNELLNPDAPVNLDAAMFMIPSAFDVNVPVPQTIPMYAAYRLHNSKDVSGGWPDGEFWAFASSVQPPDFGEPPIPEPISSSLALLALASLAARVSGRSRRVRPLK